MKPTGRILLVSIFAAICVSCGGGGGKSQPPAPRPANNAPTADISTPGDLSVFVVGDSIQFTGSGSDTEDGTLSGASLAWTSDIDGQIGTGASFNSMTLSGGTHQISMTATDSSGAVSSASTLIRVSSNPIETYPSADSSRESQLFRVEVEQGGVWVDTHAYQYSRQSKDTGWHFNLFPWVHWATIGIAQGVTVNVRVTRLNRPSGSDPFNSIEILPSRYNKNSTWDANTVTFAIEQNQKVYVRTNDQDLDTLFISAIPLSPPIPIGARYFGPGVHNLGFDYHLLASEQDVYLDGGAWVIGSIHTNDIGGDLRILGAGVLSGEFDIWENVQVLSWEDSNPYMMIHTEFGGGCPAFDVTIEGITIVASPFFNLHFGCLNGTKRIDNLHIISPWTYNTDGLAIGNLGHTTNSLIFNNDDTVHAEYIYDGDMTVSNNVLAGRNAFLIGYGYFPSGDPYNARVFDNDLILQHLYDPFHGQVDGSSPNIVVDNQSYEDIYIDGDVNRLIYLAIEDTPWGDDGSAQGNVQDLSFTNITVTGSQRSRSVIRGKDANNRIDNIQFTNLSIGGTLVTNANKDQYFEIDETTASVGFVLAIDPAAIPDQGQIFGTGGTLQLRTDVWSQSITTGISGRLSGIQLQFGIPEPPVALTLSIFEGGNPISGPELYSEQLLLTDADLDASGLFMWNLGNAGLSFDIEDIFSLRLQAQQTGFVAAGNDPPGYDGGELYKNQAPSPGLSDIAFITYVTPSN